MLEFLQLISDIGGDLRSHPLGRLPQGIPGDPGGDSALFPFGGALWRIPDDLRTEDQILVVGSTFGLHLQIFAPQTLPGRGGHVCIRPRSPLGRTWFFYEQSPLG